MYTSGHEENSAVKRVRRQMKVLLLAVNTARSLLKNAALRTGFAVDRLMLRVPFEMCIRKDTILSVVSARLVGENRWRLQEIEAPCLAMCHLHFCANAHKSLDTQVRTLRKSCVDYVCSMAADNIPDRNVGSDRVREEAAHWSYCC